MKTKPTKATNFIAMSALGSMSLLVVGYVNAAVLVLVASLLIARLAFLPNR